jgi:hypothetical protein
MNEFERLVVLRGREAINHFYDEQMKCRCIETKRAFLAGMKEWVDEQTKAMQDKCNE